MTLFAVFAAGLLTGLAAGLYAFAVWAETHHWRRIRLEAIRVDRLYHDKDHWERYARRWEHREHVARQHIGDLTIQLARIRPRRRSAVPDYGIHRQVAA